MTKQEFIDELRKKLSGIPQEDREERLAFYSEMIDDRIEEGCTDEEAILGIGTTDELAEQIIADIPLAKIAKERVKSKRRMKVWEMVLLALGSPIWISLVVAAIAVILSIYIVLWSVIVSLWAVFAALIACALVGIAAAVIFMIQKNVLTGIIMVGASLLCAGISIFMFFGCGTATKGIILLTKKIAFRIKKSFVKKEDV